MSNQFFVHVNNHVNRKSFEKMTAREKKQTQPSYTVVGILEGDTLVFGVSVCSKQDTFSKEIGRKLALTNVKEESKITIPKYVLTDGGLGKYFVTKAKRLIKKLTVSKKND